MAGWAGVASGSLALVGVFAVLLYLSEAGPQSSDIGQYCNEHASVTVAVDLGETLMLFSGAKTKRRTSAYVHTPWADLGAKIRGEKSEDESKLNLDFGRLAKLGFITPSTIELDLARDFSMVKRRLFRRLCFFGPEEDENGDQSKRRCPIVLVTSGNPGEGKTFSSINFALSLAIEEQLNVLLIDSDLANPSVPRVMGFPYRKHGLFECLAESSRRCRRNDDPVRGGPAFGPAGRRSDEVAIQYARRQSHGGPAQADHRAWLP